MYMIPLIIPKELERNLNQNLYYVFASQTSCVTVRIVLTKDQLQILALLATCH